MTPQTKPVTTRSIAESPPESPADEAPVTLTAEGGTKVTVPQRMVEDLGELGFSS